MAMRKTTENRAGFGLVLPLAVLFLAVLVPLAFSRHMQGRAARGGAQHAVEGALAHDLARSALAEGWWEVEQRLKNPSDPLSAAARDPKRARSTHKIPVTRAPRLARAESHLKGYAITGGAVTATLERHAPTGEAPHEGYTYMRLEARVAHADTGIARTLSEFRTLKMAVTSLPRPFDQFTLVVNEARSLVGVHANDQLEHCERTLSQLDALKAPMQERAGKVQGAARDALQKALTALATPAPKVGQSINDPLHYFPNRYILASRASEIPNLAALHLEPRLAKAYAEVEAAETALGQIVGAQPSPDLVATMPEAQLPAAVNALTRVARANRAYLAGVQRWQSSFIEMTAEAADWLDGLRYQLDTEEWDERAFFRFEGEGAVSKFLAMLDAAEKETPARGRDGVVYVDNANEPLKLSARRVRGRLAICATGDVTLEDVDLADHGRDRLVIQCGGTLKVAGRVRAALIAKGAFIARPGAKIAGALVLDRVDQPAELAGAVTGDAARYATGLGPDELKQALTLVLSPYSEARTMEVR
jgi:Tfp pilus assembly protein PilX